MKPCAFKGFVWAILAGCAAASLAVLSAQTDDKAAKSDSTPPLASPAATPKVKAHKQPKGPGDATPPPKIRKPKEIPFPLPIGQTAHGMKVPSYDQVGRLLSQLEGAQATRLDDQHVKWDGMIFNTNGPDGKEEYRVEMPTCIFDLKTNIVTSDQPVVIRTKDFELTGDRMQFDTVERTGELQGHIHMRIHNLKQVALPGDSTPAPK